MHFLQSGARVAHQRQKEKKSLALQNEPGQCAVLSRYPAPKKGHDVVTKAVAETARGAAGTLLRPAPANKHTCCRGKSLSQQKQAFTKRGTKQSSHRSQCQPDPNCRQHDPGKRSDVAFDQPKKADTTNNKNAFVQSCDSTLGWTGHRLTVSNISTTHQAHSIAISSVSLQIKRCISVWRLNTAPAGENAAGHWCQSSTSM